MNLNHLTPTNGHRQNDSNGHVHSPTIQIVDPCLYVTSDCPGVRVEFDAVDQSNNQILTALAGLLHDGRWCIGPVDEVPSWEGGGSDTLYCRYSTQTREWLKDEVHTAIALELDRIVARLVEVAVGEVARIAGPIPQLHAEAQLVKASGEEPSNA